MAGSPLASYGAFSTRQGGLQMGMEPNTPPVSRIIEGDYRITRAGGAIKIEVLDYHAGPLWLTDEVLKKLGLTIES